jgi:SAM-dependent methyltransferase
MTSIEELDRRYHAAATDEHVAFDRMIGRYVGPETRVLDAGAGRGLRFPYNHRDRAARVVGVDIDPAVSGNPNVSSAAIADLTALPFADGQFDVVFSKFVFEHLDRPLTAMRELHRVTKPGGHLLIHTPNRWHYVTLAAAITPTRFHVWYRGKLGWDEADTFPTRYRANTPATIERIAARSGFRVDSLVLLEGRPSYLAWHPIAYRAGIVYERLVNRFGALARLRANLLVDLVALELAPRSGVRW